MATIFNFPTNEKEVESTVTTLISVDVYDRYFRTMVNLRNEFIHFLQEEISLDEMLDVLNEAQEGIYYDEELCIHETPFMSLLQLGCHYLSQTMHGDINYNDFKRNADKFFKISDKMYEMYKNIICYLEKSQTPICCDGTVHIPSELVEFDIF